MEPKFGHSVQKGYMHQLYIQSYSPNGGSNHWQPLSSSNKGCHYMCVASNLAVQFRRDDVHKSANIMNVLRKNGGSLRSHEAGGIEFAILQVKMQFT
mmetsp:Transcript_30871/g.60268  ORF Transcript_30871/g.60268 Transcript_30871/m.60268 type:complete len:97 (+) Transcript_30871:247-537(+)